MLLRRCSGNFRSGRGGPLRECSWKGMSPFLPPSFPLSLNFLCLLPRHHKRYKLASPHTPRPDALLHKTSPKHGAKQPWIDTYKTRSPNTFPSVSAGHLRCFPAVRESRGTQVEAVFCLGQGPRGQKRSILTRVLKN